MSIGGRWIPQIYRGKLVTEIGMNRNQNRGITQSKQTLTDGTWHHVATTYDGSQQCSYIDGRLQGKVATWVGQVPGNTSDLTLGINLINPNPDYDEPGESFDGLMDEPMIFNRALSADEVKFLYKSQR